MAGCHIGIFVLDVCCVFVGVCVSIGGGAPPPYLEIGAGVCECVGVVGIGGGAPPPYLWIGAGGCECVGVVGTGGARLRPTCGGNECVWGR